VSVSWGKVHKDSDTVKAFSKELPKHEGKPEEVKEVTIDMSPAFISGVTDYLAEASNSAYYRR
jgi:hypothetical protein